MILAYLSIAVSLVLTLLLFLFKIQLKTKDSISYIRWPEERHSEQWLLRLGCATMETTAGIFFPYFSLTKHLFEITFVR